MKSVKTWLLIVLVSVTFWLRQAAHAHEATAAAAVRLQPVPVAPEVLSALESQGQADFFVHMTTKSDLGAADNLGTKEEKGAFVFETLRDTAVQSQADLRRYLDARGVDYRPYYIVNQILVRQGTAELLSELSYRPDVAEISANTAFYVPPPVAEVPATGAGQGIEPNIAFVRAPAVWALGVNGQGIVLAANDTGLDWDHEAIISHYRGWDGQTVDHNYSWWDATGAYPDAPGDAGGHGTHVSGTMVGDDGAGNRIGMAPGAQVIHCKHLGGTRMTTIAQAVECFEWDLAPWDLNGENPLPAMAPDAIANSWGSIPGGNTTWMEAVLALRAAGIAVEVSAGNEGPNCTTLRSPGDYAEVITTGSVQHSGGVLPGTITGFSSRGPSVLTTAYTPDVMAPGENVRSALPGDEYAYWSGTSMAGPHVAGLIGLMWAASPSLRGKVGVTYRLIKQTATPLTGQVGSQCGGDYTTGPNNDWGFGTINAPRAVLAAMQKAGADFRLYAQPATVNVCAGISATYPLLSANLLGYNAPVTLSVSGAPVGATATLDPAIITPPQSSLLTISDTGGVDAGNYPLIITGVGDDPAHKTHQATAFLNVSAAPPIVTLKQPVNIAAGLPLKPTFRWGASNQASAYHLQIATDAAFTDIVYTYEGVVANHTLTSSLQPLATYYWRVQAGNACGFGDYAEVRQFTTGPLPPILSEGFNQPLSQWHDGWLYEFTSAESYYVAAGINCDPDYVGNLPGSLWISDDRGCGNLTPESPVRLSFDGFADAATGFSLQMFTCVDGVTFQAYDKDGALIISEPVAEHCYWFEPHSWNLDNGLSAIEWAYTGEPAEGKVAIDEVKLYHDPPCYNAVDVSFAVGTTLSMGVHTDQPAQLVAYLYDYQGNPIRELVNESMPACTDHTFGSNVFNFGARFVCASLYDAQTQELLTTDCDPVY